MKSSLRFRGACAAAAAGLLIATTAALVRADGRRRRQRPARAAPAAGRSACRGPKAFRSSLDQAIRIALANNQDLNVTVNAAEASQFFLFQNMGIYDPLLTTNVLRSHTDQPTSSQSRRRRGPEERQLGCGHRLEPADALGRHVPTRTERQSRLLTNNSFANVNPALPSALSLSLSQPLLRNFGRLPTEINIEIARNTPGRVVPDSRAQRPDRHQLGRAVLLGPRVRAREPQGEARGPGRSPWS